MHVPEAKKMGVMAVGIEEDGMYRGRSIYLVDGHPGLFRRVSREGRMGLKHAEGHVMACIGESLAELSRWPEAEAEMAEALKERNDE